MPSRTDGDPGRGGGSWPGKLLALPNESPLKAVVVTLAVCLVASFLVAGSAVLLRPAQIANKERERQARLTEIIALLPGIESELSAAGELRLESKVVDLETGRSLPEIDPDRFDQRRAAKDPERSVAVPPERDLAQIGRRARHAVIHLVWQDERLRLVILPVHGHGFGSMLYGYLGLSADTRSVVGLRFYEHGETPGLGALIDDPGWRGQWYGKSVWDFADQPALGVAEAALKPDAPEAAYLVDALTGATWTGRGVTNLLRFWLGDDGFGPYLRNLRKERGWK